MMFKTSIYDRLQQVRPSDPTPQPTQARSDYRTDTLCLLDGVALTAAGAVAKGQLPNSVSPTLSSSLRGPDGYGLLVHQIALGQAGASLSGEDSGRLDRRHQRLDTLIQALVIDALLMLEALPEATPFDVVLTAPIRHASLIEPFLTRLRETIHATPLGEALGRVAYRAVGESSQAQSVHQLLVAEEAGGMPHVVWISVDSLLFESRVAELSRHGQLAYASHPMGLFPGEAVAALLFERQAPEANPSLQGWQLPLAVEQTHVARGSRESRRKTTPLTQLFEQHWPLPDASGASKSSPSDDGAFSPARVVIDSLGLPGRAVEVGTSLMTRWQTLDMIEDGTTLDSFCGWPGDAWLALALVLAMADLDETDGALILVVAEDTRTQGLALLPCTPNTAAP